MIVYNMLQLAYSTYTLVIDEMSSIICIKQVFSYLDDGFSRRNKGRLHLPKFRTLKKFNQFFLDRQTEIVVNREVTLPNTFL